MRKCGHCKEDKEESEFFKNTFFSSGYDNLCKICKTVYVKRYHSSEKGKLSCARSVRKFITGTEIDYGYVRTIGEDKLSEAELVFKIYEKLKEKGIESRLELTTSFGRPDIVIFKDKKPSLFIEVKKNKCNKQFNLKQEERYKEYGNYVILVGIKEVDNFIESLGFIS